MGEAGITGPGGRAWNQGAEGDKMDIQGLAWGMGTTLEGHTAGDVEKMENTVQLKGEVMIALSLFHVLEVLERWELVVSGGGRRGGGNANASMARRAGAGNKGVVNSCEGVGQEGG